jgi:hypothetical protein
METLPETSQLIIGIILGAGVFMFCRKAGLDPFERKTAPKAWAIATVFAVLFVVLSNLLMRFSA